MAIVKGPALSIDASGNVGSICYVTCRGKQIARAAWSGTPTPTGLQTAQKNRMVTAQQAWGGLLTDSERASWRAAAADQKRISRVGMTYIPTGFNYFLGLTVQLLRQGFAIRKMPPTSMVPFMFLYIEAVQVVGYPDKFRTYFRDRSPAYPSDMQGEDWMAGPYVSGGYHPQKPDYRFQEFRSISGGNLYNGMQQGVYYWFKMRWIDEIGRVGNWFETSIILPL